MGKLILTCIALLIASSVAFIALENGVLNGHEVFVSVTAREMIANNNYIIPTFNNNYRLNKTPLPYWLVVAAEHFTGRIDEFTARFPTAALSVLSVAGILYFVTILLDFRTAFLASLIWTCSLGFIRYSHCARPEMALTFFMLVSFLSFYAAVNEENRKRQILFSLIFWISLGLSVLAKAPSSVIFMALSAAGYLTLFKQWNKASKILPVWGMLLFLLIVLPWPIAAANAMHWDLSIWRHESVDRFMDAPEDGHFTWFYYVPRMFLFMIPWVVLLPYALVAPFFKVWGHKRQIMGYLWICFFSGILFLSVCSGKRPHYILPLMPMAAILTGIVAEDILFNRKAYREKECRALLKGHIIALFIAGIAALSVSFKPFYTYLIQWLNSYVGGFSPGQNVFPVYSGNFAAYALAIGMSLIAGAMSGLYLYRIHKQLAAGTAVFIAIAITTVLGCCSIPLWPDSYTSCRAEFAVEMSHTIPADKDVFALGQVDDVLVHYFGRPFKNTEESQIQQLYDNNGWLMVSHEYLRHFREEHNYNEVLSFSEKRNNELREIAVFHKGDAGSGQ